MRRQFARILCQLDYALIKYSSWRRINVGELIPLRRICDDDVFIKKLAELSQKRDTLKWTNYVKNICKSGNRLAFLVNRLRRKTVV